MCVRRGGVEEGKGGVVCSPHLLVPLVVLEGLFRLDIYNPAGGSLDYLTIYLELAHTGQCCIPVKTPLLCVCVCVCECVCVCV